MADDSTRDYSPARNSMNGVAVRIPVELRRRMKILATQRDTSLYALTSIALEQFLAREERAATTTHR